MINTRVANLRALEHSLREEVAHVHGRVVVGHQKGLAAAGSEELDQRAGGLQAVESPRCAVALEQRGDFPKLNYSPAKGGWAGPPGAMRSQNLHEK
jgi:hypothetical protein